MEVLLFGGTTEGRLLAEWLAGRGTCHVVVCVATAYGSQLVTPHERIVVQCGPLSAEQKMRLVTQHDFACVVDATHPYAQHISCSVDELASEVGLPVVRVIRADEAPLPEDVCCQRFATMDEAAQHVARTQGNVLLTTGTKDLATFVRAMDDFHDRLYVRVLPSCDALAATEALDVPASHVLAVQGPCSALLNRAIIEGWNIRHLVTKQSGATGGFDQKVQAVQDCGIELVVIDRPEQREGMTLEEAKVFLEERYGL